MRAWQVDKAAAPRQALRLVDVDPPAVAAGLVRVRVAAAAVGLPDVLLCRGSYPLTPPLPFTPGQEMVGEVTAVGDRVDLRIGERVMGVAGFHLGAGSLAEECLALGDFCLAVPDEMSSAEAAGFSIAYHTAYTGLVRRGALRRGEVLLVLGGAGGTGSAAIQLGAALGGRVLATAGGPEKVAYCEEIGAELVIDYRRQEIAEAVRAATAGRGADLVYDPVGGEAFAAATHCVAPEGRILLIGFASGSWAQPSVPHMVVGNYSLVGVLPDGLGTEFRQDAHNHLLDHWRAGRLAGRVHREYGFDEVPMAIEEVASGRAMGKVVVVV